jgi:hypothetical protein
MSANGGILVGNPYKPIATRNVFALNAISLAQSPVLSPAPLARISLTGITTILGAPDVLFKVSNPAEPGKQGKSYILEGGQIQDDVEVISIDAKGGSVVFRNHGVIQKISFESGSTPTQESKGPPVSVRNIF